MQALALQLVLRAHPEWSADPVVVVEDDRPLASILWCNRAARSHRIRRGMSFAHARALHATLRVEVVPEQAIEAAIDALFELLLSFSPSVEPSLEQPGLFWLDPRGLHGLFGELERWAARVHDKLRDERYVSAVVVGQERGRVYALACTRVGTLVLRDAEHERQLSAAVPLSRLGISPKLRDDLALLDIHGVGELLALDGSQLRIRYGEEAARLHAFLNGKSWTPLLPRVPSEPLRVVVDVDPPDDDCARLLFGWKAALDQAATRLRAEQHAITALELLFELERKSVQARRERVETAAPTLDVLQIVDLLRLRLQNVALPSRVERIVTTIEHTRVHARQLAIGDVAIHGVSEANLAVGWGHDGFAGGAGRARALPDIKPGWGHDGFAGGAGRARALPGKQNKPRDLEAAARAIARLRASFGPEAVTCARLCDVYFPEAAFRFEPARELRLPRAVELPTEPPLVRRLYASPLALPPRPSHEPEAWLGSHGAVTAMLGPHRILSGWWSERGATERDYYFVETQQGKLLWMFYDRVRRKWFLQGVVD